MQRRPTQRSSNDNTQRTPNVRQIRSNLGQYVRDNWFLTLIGTVIFGAGIGLIIHNEARAAQVTRTLYESIALVTQVSPYEHIDPSNIGKLIYFSGVVKISEPLTEEDYGISVMAVKLLRQVQMYQWIETESKIYDDVGNVLTTSYHYHTDWHSRVVDSSSFSSPVGHWNPKEFPVKRQTQINENVKVGNFRLSLELKKKFKDFVAVTSDERPERKDIKLHSGLYYHCQDLFKPEVGDIRIQFYYAGHQGQIVTVVAQLDENFNLVPYHSKFGVSILILKLGEYTLEEVFVSEHSQNKFMTWLYRGGTWFLLYISCAVLAPILHHVFAHSPFLQEFFPVSHSSLKMTVSMCTSLMATALAWLWYRPILGVGLIFVSVLYLCFIKWILKNRIGRTVYNRL